jgi:hypothetical protein
VKKIPAMLYVGKGPVLSQALSLCSSFLSRFVGVLCLVKFTGVSSKLRKRSPKINEESFKKQPLKYLLVFVELHLLSLLNPIYVQVTTSIR